MRTFFGVVMATLALACWGTAIYKKVSSAHRAAHGTPHEATRSFTYPETYYVGDIYIEPEPGVTVFVKDMYKADGTVAHDFYIESEEGDL